MYGPFLERAGASPVVACVVLDEGDGTARFARWADVLRRTAPCEPVPVLVPEGGRLSVGELGAADALLVCGGLTPAYAAALVPSGVELLAWLAEGDRPYGGFSAGASVAAVRAVVGGWRAGGVAVCPEDAAEDLDQVSVVDGLGLVPWSVDVHCAQWGTLPRLLSVVGAGGRDGGGVGGGRAGVGVGIDENTALHVDGDSAVVGGLGAVRHVVATATGAAVTTFLAGASVPSS